MGSQFAVGLSTHPEPAVAAGEAIGSVLQGVGVRPDLAMVFISGAMVSHAAGIRDAIASLLDPVHLIGACVQGIVGGSEEIRSPGPAAGGGDSGSTHDGRGSSAGGLVVWAGRLPSHNRHLRTFQLHQDASGMVFGLPSLQSGDALIVLADQASFDPGAMTSAVADTGLAIPIVGATLSVDSKPTRPGPLHDSHEPTPTRMLIGRQQLGRGAVGIALPTEAISITVSPGAKAMGEHFTVGEIKGNRIGTLNGQPAGSKLDEFIAGLSAEDRFLASQGLCLGISAQGEDVAVLAIAGRERSTNALVLRDNPSLGQGQQARTRPFETAQFHLADPIFASNELERKVALQLADKRPAGALIFNSCERRDHVLSQHSSEHMQHSSDHMQHRSSAEIVDELSKSGIAGLLSNSEFGPSGDANRHQILSSTIVWFN